MLGAMQTISLGHPQVVRKLRYAQPISGILAETLHIYINILMQNDYVVGDYTHTHIDSTTCSDQDKYSTTILHVRVCVYT